MTSSVIAFDISPSDPACPLGVEVWLGQQQIFDTQHLVAPTHISHSISDEDAEHELRVVLKNKLPEHTTIDADGTIVQDAVITVTNFEFEEIDVDQIVVDHAVYLHNFNSTGPDQQHRFYGTMGCNGTVSLKFSTPIYLWLLEHM
jgi:hypothetical protein